MGLGEGRPPIQLLPRRSSEPLSCGHPARHEVAADAGVAREFCGTTVECVRWRGRNRGERGVLAAVLIALRRTSALGCRRRRHCGSGAADLMAMSLGSRAIWREQPLRSSFLPSTRGRLGKTAALTCVSISDASPDDQMGQPFANFSIPSGSSGQVMAPLRRDPAGWPSPRRCPARPPANVEIALAAGDDADSGSAHAGDDAIELLARPGEDGGALVIVHALRSSAWCQAI